MGFEILSQAAVTAPGLCKEIYGDLLKPGVAQVGKALGTIIGLGNTALFPIQMLNERTSVFLQANMERYREKLEHVPVEEISPVTPEIGVPIAEKLAYVQDDGLSELYTALLASASVINKLPSVHPAFVHIINNLCPDEAQLLRQFGGQDVPFVDVMFFNKGARQYNVMRELELIIKIDIKLAFPEHKDVYVSNLEGLGIVAIRRDVISGDVKAYKGLEKRMRESAQETELEELMGELQFRRGSIHTTGFGKLFLRACGM